MSTIEVLEKKPVNMSELKEELSEIKKRDGELSFRAQKTEEYITELSLIKAKGAEELFKEIEKMNVPRLREVQINKIIDMMPKSVNELKVVLQGYSIPVTNENMKKIVDLVAEYAK